MVDCAECIRLQDRIAELEELLGMDDFANPELNWTTTERKVAGLFARRAFWTKEALYVALYAERPDVDQPQTREITAIWAHKLRKRLRLHDITLRTAWGIGFWLDAADQQKLRALILPAGSDAQK